MSTKERLDMACRELRQVIKNERMEERCARLWAKVIAENDSTQKRKARALQNGRVLV